MLLRRHRLPRSSCSVDARAARPIVGNAAAGNRSDGRGPTLRSRVNCERLAVLALQFGTRVHAKLPPVPDLDDDLDIEDDFAPDTASVQR